jgi:poly-gamma-glutamate capsule biosynthesis protein CapA/YwtB (metallophosphatase superfamily)
MRLIFLCLLCIALGIGGTILQKTAMLIQHFELPSSQYGLLSTPTEPGTLLMGGDIMLARAVEGIMIEKGASFPFTGIFNVIQEHDVAVANFESSVPKEHVPTPSMKMRFSVPEYGLTELARVGFDVLSLSNNHALDYGKEGYVHTKEACVRNGLVCIGHPVVHDKDSMTVVDVKGTRVGILMLHTLFEKASTTELLGLVDALETMSDIQYVFIHWGEEYERFHNASQEELAHALIDGGIDGVIGHHPHVMQDIELYKGKPIFYSLGNLIFDQYFSPDVQEGFLVSISIDEKSIEYTLIPYDMHDERTQPRLQEGDEKIGTLRTLLRYPLFTEAEIEAGTFEVLR